MGRTLVVERHDWETSGSSHQLQFPLDAHSGFFGTFVGTRTFRIFDPASAKKPKKVVDGLISYYAQSDTYRINKVLELGDLQHAVVFIEEFHTHDGDISYDIWWFDEPDASVILAMPWQWQQAKDSQHGPGRFWTILDNSGPRAVSAGPRR